MLESVGLNGTEITISQMEVISKSTVVMTNPGEVIIRPTEAIINPGQMVTIISKGQINSNDIKLCLQCMISTITKVEIP